MRPSGVAATLGVLAAFGCDRAPKGTDDDVAATAAMADTLAAIADLDALVRDANITLDARAPQNKPFFDLLGIAYLRLGEQENRGDGSFEDVTRAAAHEHAKP